MRCTGTLVLIAAAVALCAAGAPACSKRPTGPPTRSILVKYRFAPGAVTKAQPKKEFRCVAYRVEVTNRGYERVEFDRDSFTLDVEGKTYLAADTLACPTTEPADPARLGDGRAWKGTVTFEQPSFTLDARVLLKPVLVKGGGLSGLVSAPVIDYQISSGN